MRAPGKSETHLHLQRLQVCICARVIARLLARSSSDGFGHQLREGDAERRNGHGASLHVRVRDTALGKARLKVLCVEKRILRCVARVSIGLELGKLLLMCTP